MRSLPVWPAERLGEALHALARQDASTLATPQAPYPVPVGLEEGHLDLLVEQTAGRLGMECLPIAVEYRQVGQKAGFAGPAIFRLPEGSFVVLLRNGKVLGPDLKCGRVFPCELRSHLFSRVEAPASERVDRALDASGVPPRRRKRLKAAILRDLLAATEPVRGWQLNERPGLSFRRLAQAAHLDKGLAALAAAHVAQYLLLIAAWWMIGQGVLAGRIDSGSLWAWALLLLTSVPLRVVTTWLQGRIAIGAGGLLKERLLYGALRLETEQVRHQGVGQLLGRVIESDALESLALSGGFLALAAILELAVASALLVLGAGGAAHAAIFACWVAITLLAGWRYFRRAANWTTSRLGMTNDLVERLVGHRTRLAQEPIAGWHREEDMALAQYLETSQTMDRASATLLAFSPRGWLVVGLLCLAPAFVAGSGSTALLAVGLGGNLLAYRAFKRLVSGLRYVAGAWIAGKQVGPLFHAAAKPELAGSPAAAIASHPQERGYPVLDAQDLVFRYRGREEPVLRGCNLRVHSGDRTLLEGPSGGGKSTLASLVAGLCQPDSGLLLLGGWDRSTLGTAGWRRLVAFAPQFHENHVLTGTLLFNALMGRARLLTLQDAREAEEVCRELGLSGLLERMPSGMLQIVGESGWQLSHGERSRLYIARALLQNAELVVLDESFAALDPENLRLAFECVRRRARTILAIAHQ